MQVRGLLFSSSSVLEDQPPSGRQDIAQRRRLTMGPGKFAVAQSVLRSSLQNARTHMEDMTARK